MRAREERAGRIAGSRALDGEQAAVRSGRIVD